MEKKGLIMSEGQMSAVHQQVLNQYLSAIRSGKPLDQAPIESGVTEVIRQKSDIEASPTKKHLKGRFVDVIV
jgi:hypothetical protein